MMPHISVVIIDGDATYRNGIETGLKGAGDTIDVSAAVGDFQEGVKKIQSAGPQIVILAVDEIDRGVKETAFITSRFPAVTVFVATNRKDPDWILRLMRAGAGEYLAKPIVPAELEEAIRRVRRHQTRNEPAGKAEGVALAVYNPMGGMGTTTLAVNLAAALATQGERVALLDLNLLSGDVTTFLNLPTRYTVASLTGNLTRVDASFVTSVVDRHSCGVHVLGAPANIEEAAAITPDQLHQVVAVMKTAFTYTIIDTSGPLFGCNEAVFAQSDHLLFNMVLSLPALKNAKRYLSVLAVDPAGRGRVKLVVNRHLPKDDIKLTDVEKVVKIKAYSAIPNGYEEVKASIHKGAPVIACYPKSPVSRAITDLARQISLEICADSANI